jgi:6-pyruvoyltetrahydropterin/6-carboxytetrahydropterin synthase
MNDKMNDKLNLKTSVTKCFEFEMGHVLTTAYAEECQKPHGHSYKLEVTFSGDIQEDGVIIDFKKIGEMVKEEIDFFDHNFLDEKNFGCNPTAENIAMLIFRKLRLKTPLLVKIKLWETSSCFVEVAY